MQTIVVTGGSGKLGVWVIKEFVLQGFRVVSLDEKWSDKLNCKQINVNLTDLGQVVGALNGADAVIHLAAIPAPLGYTNDYIFGNNVRATYNVLEAASILGIKKVIIGSSESAYGFCWAPKPFSPNYVPVDEEHPSLPQECYGLSKIVGEQTGEMFYRRTGMQVFSMRFSMIIKPQDYSLSSISKPEQYVRILWSYIDIRDAASACIAALHSNAEGHHTLNITSDDTLSDWPTEQLLSKFYPDVKDHRLNFSDREAIVSNKLAKSILDWNPIYSWDQIK
ncbi:NAD-dependent epimerase/dehydratase family protein [Cohnella abietis]|uniref:Nucleoside-diphosphate-sugar epimerase n=1 Tax=Cohnella abietis TaxID=2507935 RepID=A0A3T1D0U5_9BACL|nr:NAD(P)-dependent oxidoreductase [Cohnella abietis]BBI31681.1 nucleoside-diphosphate-sugar epimerase [Cohnella abietis]